MRRRILVAGGLVAALVGFGLLTHSLRQAQPTGAALGVAEPPSDLALAPTLELPRGPVEGQWAVKTPDGWEVVEADSAEAARARRPQALLVEPVFHTQALGTPNDPRYPWQWNLQVLDMPSAWDSSQGAEVVIAVLDTGVSQELDGFLDLLPGYDAIADREGGADDGWHGTHVAGVLAQATNNGEGVAGMAPRASVLPVKVLSSNGGGTSVALARGIRWAADNGADVINLSLGLDESSATVEEACDYARDKGVVLVAATGNDGLRAVQYPAAYASVIAVAALDLNLELTDYSNVGPEVDLVAPGGDLSEDLDGDGLADGVMQAARMDGEWQYVLAEGTSLAAPHVSGAAALLLANGVPPSQVRDRLLGSAEDLGDAGHDPYTGWGLLDPVRALQDTTASVDESERYAGSWTGEAAPPAQEPMGCSTAAR